MSNNDNSDFTQAGNFFNQTTTPNPDQGTYTTNLPLISPTLGVKIPADVPSHDGIQPSTGFIYAGSFGAPLGPWVTGQFYGTMGSTTEAVQTVTATLYATPVFIPNLVTVKSLNLSVTTGETGGAADIGIYADNGAGYPGTLVYDSGALTTLTGTAVKTQTLSTTAAPAIGVAFNETTTLGVTTSGGSPLANNQLVPGLYWFASIFTASSTFISVVGIDPVYTNFQNALLGQDTAAHALATSGEAATGISVAGTYGALPLTFPASATLTLNAATPTFVLGV
jgi:hypothetical protein